MPSVPQTTQRPKDLQDIAPTPAELAFAARELPRLSKIDAARAKRMRGVLDVWPGTANPEET